MKLNNKGWGLQEMLVCILILMLILIVTSVSLNKLFNEINGNVGNSNNSLKNEEEKEELNNQPEEPKIEVKKTYEDLENDVKEATIKYQNNNYNELVEDEKITVTINNLVKEKLIKDVVDIKDNSKCSGYGLFVLEDGNVNYSAYLKCSNYKTNGYNEIFDIK